jgi:hypothetical protein
LTFRTTSPAPHRSGEERARKTAEYVRTEAETTRARLEDFLPDVRMIGREAGDALRRMVYAPDPLARYRGAG